MSLPISTCMIRKALTDDEALAELARRLKYNKKFGGMTIFGCVVHKPYCTMIDEREAEILNKRLERLYKESEANSPN
jgi:hypothetical protein